MTIETRLVVHLTYEEYNTLDKACDIIDNIVAHLNDDHSDRRGLYEELLESLLVVLHTVETEGKN